MGNKATLISEFLKLKENHLIIDVRSPAEFEKGHIPGAVNIPVLNNSARKEIGIIYATSNSQQAVLKDLKLQAQILKIGSGKPLILLKTKKSLFIVPGEECEVLLCHGFSAYQV